METDKGDGKMKAEIIAVGTELLLGQIVNTNAQFLSQQCAAIGVNVYFQTVVGDNGDRLYQAFTNAKERADLIICTGGLGPTQDDLTKDVLASFTGRKLIMHEPSLNKIKELFSNKNMPIAESSARQALMLEGSEPLANDAGLAVGVALEHDGTYFMLLPGPPREMKTMFEHYGKDWILGVNSDSDPLYSKMLKFAGIGESAVEKELLDLIESQSDPTIAPYAKEGEVTIRLTTRAKSPDDAILRLSPVEEEIRSRLAAYLYADEDKPIEEIISQHLIEQGKTIATAESCTGGLISEMLTCAPDGSKMFKGGVVCYTNYVKHKLLGIPMEQLEGDDAPGAVSEQTAEMLAANTLRIFDCDYSLAVTGVAGPGTMEGKPVGLVFIGIGEKGKPVEVIEGRYSGNRDQVKHKVAKTAFYHLWKRLNGQS